MCSWNTHTHPAKEIWLETKTAEKLFEMKSTVPPTSLPQIKPSIHHFRRSDSQILQVYQVPNLTLKMYTKLSYIQLQGILIGQRVGVFQFTLWPGAENVHKLLA